MSFSFPVDIVDHHPDTFSLVPMFTANLVIFRKACLEVPTEVDDQITSFEALDHSVHQIAFTIHVFFKDFLSDGFAYLLNQYLFGCLGGDPSEGLGSRNF